MKNNATFDVIVIGLGIMGASATMQLAKSGKRVLAIDARAPSHCEWVLPHRRANIQASVLGG